MIVEKGNYFLIVLSNKKFIFYESNFWNQIGILDLYNIIINIFSYYSELSILRKLKKFFIFIKIVLFFTSISIVSIFYISQIIFY